MKQRKVNALITLFLCTAMIMAGCSKGSTGSTTTAPAASSTATESTAEVSTSTEATSTEASAELSAESSVADTTAQLEKADLTIFIAASLSNAMEEVQKLYAEAQPNVTITFNADSSGTLQKQIEEGAACDMFFSAATKQMDALEKESLVDSSSVVDLLKNQVVLIKAKGATTKVTGFDNITDAANLALAGEDVPVGQYAREIFTSMGTSDKVMKMEINECANVTAVLTSVSEKSNEVGVVYATDAASMPDTVEVIAAAPDTALKTPVVYPVGLVANKEASEAQTAAAKDFLTFLQTGEALKVFEKYGFTIK